MRESYLETYIQLVFKVPDKIGRNINEALTGYMFKKKNMLWEEPEAVPISSNTMTEQMVI